MQLYCAKGAWSKERSISTAGPVYRLPELSPFKVSTMRGVQGFDGWV